jgi:hypoxanthine phosphoribosyltransferase
VVVQRGVLTARAGLGSAEAPLSFADATIRTLYDEQQIRARVAELGAQITRDYTGRNLVLVCILKGSFVFAADLARAIDLPLRIDFLGVQSYGDDTESSGVVQITQDLTRLIVGEDVLIIEDIVDTGLTLAYIRETLQARNPKTLGVCALLHKPQRLKTAVQIEYLGFTLANDVFVVGYGLDWAQKYRNLPVIGVVES